MTNSKIISLQAENVKRLKAVEITPDGAVVVVSGRNGQGKSSVLDAIWMALGGKRAFPRRPVRDGAEEASIRLELGDLIVERRIKPDGRTTLIVSSPEGARYGSPQAMLDKLVGALSFDPLAFSRMDPKAQRELLRELVGIDTSEVDRQRAEYYAERTRLGRDLKQAKGALASLPHHEDAPTEPISVSELAAEMRAADEAERELARAKESHARGLSRLDEAHAFTRQMEARIETLEEELKVARERLQNHLDDEVPKLTEETVAAGERADQLAAALPDRQSIEARLASADEMNAKRTDNERREDAAEQVTRLGNDIAELTEAIALCDERKARLLEDASFPLPGLGIDDHGVRLEGVPFEQASSAEQLRASVAIGLALHPELRVLLVRDGSLLDDESMKLLAELAAESDAQVWLERVGAEEGVGVVIEDGEVAS